MLMEDEQRKEAFGPGNLRLDQDLAGDEQNV